MGQTGLGAQFAWAPSIVNSGNPELTYRLLAGGKTQKRAIGHISYTLECCGWSVPLASKALSVSERTLYGWLSKYPAIRERRYKAQLDGATQSIAGAAIGSEVDIPE